jgi:2-dehydro-3-deoxyphosphogluconate aldolase/(4S)-4-hydroxy-2-oxoglutarate aldolase
MNTDMTAELARRPIIPVIVIDDADRALPLAEALLAGGLDVIEVTCRTRAAEESLTRIRKSFPEMLLGAGTVVTHDQARMVLDAGVGFGLAPGLNPEIVTIFQQAGKLFIPGIMTPTDIEKALSLGCTMLKFFPAGAAGGPKMLQSMSGPYTSLGVRFCPTGGVNLENMNDYLRLPVVSNVGGSWLATKDQISEERWTDITRQVKEALARAAEAAG